MNRALPLLVLICALLWAASPSHAAPALERGTAITDPAALRELDQGRLGLAHTLAPEQSGDQPLSNRDLFALPSLSDVREAIVRELDRYIERHKARLPNESIGTGDGFDFQLFDRTWLDSPVARFVLAGIVNRMDRAYVAPDGCGEVRLIYRLTRTDGPLIGESAVSQRLPMTVNVVLKANAGRLTCAATAQRWLATGNLMLDGAALANALLAQGGALEFVGSGNIRRIETNLQIAHAPKSAVRDFRTDYLLKVFDYGAAAQRFAEAPLENQIDRDRLLADEGLRREFRDWLLDVRHFSELDRGTLVIPDKFLARAAIAPTPVGFDLTELQPEFGLVQRDGGPPDPAFSDNDVIAALQKAAREGVTLQNIRSVAGFERRLNDVTCAGCHQTRGIGGFHFPGVDWMAAKPSNTMVVPASPQFFGDQPRRRDILAAFTENRLPDFSRGFSSRPQSRGSSELAGTEYDDGWGAHCYQPGPKAADTDRSFRGFTCAEGLACQVAGKTSRMGMCFVRGR